MVSVCFVCLGNICRSPTAEGVLRHLIEQAGLESHIVVDSAGTGAYHVGEPADRRAQAAAKARGITLSGRARQFAAKDFQRFDYVLAMDGHNLANLLRIAPADAKAKVRLLRSFDPDSPPDASVPDPYFGAGDGFDEVLDQCERACRNLLIYIRREHGL